MQYGDADAIRGDSDGAVRSALEQDLQSQWNGGRSEDAGGEDGT